MTKVISTANCFKTDNNQYEKAIDSYFQRIIFSLCVTFCCTSINNIESAWH